MSAYQWARRLLFTLPTEVSHEITLDGLAALERLGLIGLLRGSVEYQPQTVMGLHFPNPVGLAAGLDKNGDCIDALAALGFGYIEIGTVTPRPQAGNPKPRLFRLSSADAIINRMGFNNKGVDYLVNKVKQSRYKGILGINIGKNKDTSADLAVQDYLICLRKVYEVASYITINISSPNTPGLRDLQFGESLKALLGPLKQEQLDLAQQHGVYKPMVVKVAPDMDAQTAGKIAELLLDMQFDGVIATNTTVDKTSVAHLKFGGEQGGLSGRPLASAATATVAAMHGVLGDKLPIIGVGGVSDGATAREKIHAGASLLQVYSGFIYRGPEVISEVAKAVQQMRA